MNRIPHFWLKLHGSWGILDKGMGSRDETMQKYKGKCTQTLAFWGRVQR